MTGDELYLDIRSRLSEYSSVHRQLSSDAAASARREVVLGRLHELMSGLSERQPHDADTLVDWLEEEREVWELFSGAHNAAVRADDWDVAQLLHDGETLLTNQTAEMTRSSVIAIIAAMRPTGD
jgi:hypothetical protein